MKKNTTKLFFICIFFASCQLFEPKPESEKFYCKINGRAWRPEKKTLPTVSANPLRAEWNKKCCFNISAYNENEDIHISLKLSPNERITIKDYQLSNVTPGNIGNYFYNSWADSPENLKSTSGIISIIKVENNIISGTFEFTTYSDIKKKTYKITKGQFNDLAYSEIG